MSIVCNGTMSALRPPYSDPPWAFIPAYATAYVTSLPTCHNQRRLKNKTSTPNITKGSSASGNLKKNRNNSLKLIVESTLTFDMQQVLTSPKMNVGTLYYKRKYNTYNFTVYSLKDTECDCYMWHETTAKRGSCEMATWLQQYIQLSLIHIWRCRRRG